MRNKHARRNAPKRERATRRPKQRTSHWDERKELQRIELELRRGVEALTDDRVDAQALDAIQESLNSAPDQLRLAEKVVARGQAMLEINKRAARIFASWISPMISVALESIAIAGTRSDQSGAGWDEARELSRRLHDFLARHGITTRSVDSVDYLALLDGPRKVELIKDLRMNGVEVAGSVLPLSQSDASAVIGVNENYVSTVRARKKRTLSK